MTYIAVREHARLTTEHSTKNTLDKAGISQEVFDFLLGMHGSEPPEKSNDFLNGLNRGVPFQIENRTTLQLGSYVGFIQTPYDTQIEILPKVIESDTETDIREGRKLLRKMLETALHLTPRNLAGKADIQLFNEPLFEWVIWQFLEALDRIVKYGIRLDYTEKDEEQKFLRGRLDMPKQLRQIPGRQHVFQIRHQVFLPDRPENRLIKAALNKVCKRTQEPQNRRFAHILAGMLEEIPASPSSQILQDFREWKTDRLMSHYQAIKPWCQLILGDQMPVALKGDRQGISMLFPMETLFEHYVFLQLRSRLVEGAILETPQVNLKSLSLSKHKNDDFFQLLPDMLLKHNKKRMVMDAKWKLVRENDKDSKYGLSQDDFYQLFAYGHKYQNGSGDMLLVYPKTKNFKKHLPAFELSDGYRLWVVPFDLKTNHLDLPIEIKNSEFGFLQRLQ